MRPAYPLFAVSNRCQSKVNKVTCSQINQQKDKIEAMLKSNLREKKITKKVNDKTPNRMLADT